MDINGIYENLRNMNDDTIGKSVKFFLIKESDTDKKTKVVYSVDMESDVQKNLYNIVINFFRDKRKREREQKDYDIVMQHSHFKGYYLLGADKYESVKNFTALLEKREKISSIKGYEITDFFAYAISITINNQEKVYFIGEISALSKLSKTKVLGNLKDNKLKSVKEDNLLGFSSNMGMFIYKEELLINQIRLFEKCCNMSTEFEAKAITFIDSLKELDSIENFDDFQKISDVDAGAVRRLAKLSEYPDRVKKFFDNKDEIKTVLESEEFKEKFEGIKLENGKLLYDENYRHQFITLISDSAYESIVGKEKRIDETL